MANMAKLVTMIMMLLASAWSWSASHSSTSQAPVEAGRVLVNPASPPIAQSVFDAASTRTSFTQTVSLSDFGERKIQLIGDGDVRSFYVGVRSDHVVEAAQLKLHFKFSPGLLPRLSQLLIRLNQQLVAVLPVSNVSESDVDLTAIVPLDPRLFAEDNWLSVQLVGHYTVQDCEDPKHSSIWLNLDAPKSTIQLRLNHEHLSIDLGLLPNPWLDKRDKRNLEVNIATGPNPDLMTLQAAAKLASWLGTYGEGRRVNIKYFRDVVPAGHVVVLSSGEHATIGDWHLPEVGQATVRIAEHPTDKEARVLLIQGKTSAELDEAVMGMVLGQGALTGSMVAFDGPISRPLRKPYDSPRWVSTDKPIRLSQIIQDPQALNISGKSEQIIRAQFRLAPDIWVGPGAHPRLRLRFRANSTNAIRQDDRLSLMVNGALIQNWRLPPTDEPDIGILGEALPPTFRPRSDFIADSTIDRLLPGEDNTLEVAIPLGVKPVGGKCSSTLETTFASIHPDSQLDLTDLPHYKGMPDIKAFRETGYPFTRMADLSETVAVLPEKPENAHIEALLSIMSDMGRWSGVAATSVRVVSTKEEAEFIDKDILWISTGKLDDATAPWGKQLALTNEFTGGSDVVGGQWLNWVRKLTVLEGGDFEGLVKLALSGPIAILAEMQSPWTPRRTLMLLYGARHDSLQALNLALTTPSQAYKMSGGMVVLRSNEVDVIDRRITYYTGELPFLSWLGLKLGERPVFIIAILLLGTLGVLIFGAQRLVRRMRSRLSRDVQRL